MSRKPFYKTAFSDWGLVNFLQDKVGDKAGDIAKNVAEVVLMGESPVKAVMDIVRGDNSGKFSQEDILKAMDLAEKDFERYKQEVELEKLYNEGVSNARSAELDRMRLSENWVTRNMNTIIALVVIVGYFGLVTMVIFTTIEPSAQRILDIAFGTISGALLTIIGYYFHRSKREDTGGI